MPVTPEALKAVRELLPEARTITRMGVAQWAEVAADGSILLKYFAGAACHGSMGYKGPANTMLFVQQETKWEPELKEAFRAFVKWMCVDSPFSVFVVNKDNLDELCDGGAIWDSDASGHKLSYFFAKTFRYTTEDTFRPLIWHELVSKYDVHPMTALVACSCLTSFWTNQVGSTHNSTLINPRNINDLCAILTKKWEGGKSRSFFSSPEEGEPHDSFDIFYPLRKTGCFYAPQGTLIQAPRERQEKIPDGWGGYTYKRVAASREDFAEHLKELTKEALNGTENVVEGNAGEESSPAKKPRVQGVRRRRRV